MEEWRDIPGYEGLYQVSNLGRVKSLNYGKTGKEGILKPVKKLKRNGNYYAVRLYKNTKWRSCWVHRLVATAFIPNPDNKPCVDHINRNPSDNRVTNLRWVTHKENTNNPLTLEVYRKNGDIMKETRLGGKNPGAKPVVQLSLDNIITNIWECGKDVEKQLGYSQRAISACCNNIYCKNKNMYKGYRWMFKSEYEKLYGKIDE